MNSVSLRYTSLILIATALSAASGCSIAPKMKDRASFLADSREAVTWFEDNVCGLKEQIATSAGYTVFPDVLQWGIMIGGGHYGRGMVAESDGKQVGWSAAHNGSLGLQVGVHGYKMLIVFEDDVTFDKFKKDKLSGSVAGVAVLADLGGSAKAPFENGVAVYHGANLGVMAGVNVGLDLVSFRPLGYDDCPSKP